MSTFSVETQLQNEQEHRHRLALAINQLYNGRSNAVGSFTVANATTTTQVDNALAHSGSVPMIIPADATAAAITPYVSARAAGSFTLTHADPGGAAVFYYILLG